MRKGGEEGFILPAVLWIIAALALISAVTAQWVSNGVENARLRKTEAEGERLMFETQSMVVYRMTTSFFTSRGLELTAPGLPAAQPDVFGSALNLNGPFVALDDRPYDLNGIEVRFQDSRGLLNLNLASDDEIFRLLGVMGIPLEMRGPLIAKLKDYISTGDLMRLNGAKRNEYLAAGRMPPSYLPLVTPYEAQFVLDWDKFPSLWSETNGLPAFTTTASTAVGINLNTAPASVLALVEGMNPEGVQKLLQFRMTTPVNSIQDVAAASGVTILDNPLRYIFFPSDTLRLRMHVPGRTLERLMVVRLTPQDPAHPFRIDYSIDVPPLTDDDQPAQPFPLAPASTVSMAP